MLLQQIAEPDFAKLASLVSPSDRPFTGLNAKNSRRPRHCNILKASAIQIMCKKMNKRGPRSLVICDWQTAFTITRQEDSTVKYNTEFVDIVLDKLFPGKCKMLLTFTCII